MKALLCFCTAVLCLSGTASISNAQMSAPVPGVVAQDAALDNYSANCLNKEMKTKTLRLTADDNGREFRVSPGTEISVELEVQGGTGYNWYTDRLVENHLKPAGSRTKDISKRGSVGGPVLGVWRFRTAAPGLTRLRMLYYRAWEGKEHAIKAFEVRLDITGK